MNYYVAGTDLSFQIALANDDGVPIEATTAEYAVLDGAGAVLQPLTSLAVNGSEAEVEVEAAYNMLPAGVVSDAREIKLHCQTEAGLVVVTHTYVIEAVSGALVRGGNTLVTLGTADMLASTMSGISGWKTATRRQKVSALLEAYKRLGKLRLTRHDTEFRDYTSAPYPIAAAGTLVDMTPSEVLALDAKMLAALSLGQVSEADAILSGDDAVDRRSDGVILETIGDVKKMFRGSKPLPLVVNKRTMGYLSAYVSVSTKVIGRA